MRRCCGTVLVALLALATAATGALAHGGGGTDYISEVRAVSPADGLSVEVLDRDDRLVLRNESGKTVVVGGYNGEPYARLLPDGTVEVNLNSPAHYLNDDRFAKVDVPERADESAAPAWKRLDRSGSFEWHDHRMHWMGAERPPVVEDEAQRTKVFDWRVPIEDGDRPGEIAGTLTWVGRPDDGFPVAAAVALAALALGGVALIVVVRRGRARRDQGTPPTGRAEREAW